MKDITVEELDELLTVACRDRDAYAKDLRAAEAEVERLRGELAEAQATIANECGEGEPPEPGWTWEQRTERDAVGYLLRRYRAWIWGPEETGFEVMKEKDGRWSVALESDRISYYRTARDAMRAAMVAFRAEKENP